jgi:hypothetical protein
MDKDERQLILIIGFIAILIFVTLVAGTTYETKLEHEEQMLTLELLGGECRPPGK